ncbi:MAG: hypothetical protein HOO67_02195 [Candidatus Peribacteraceae bacterium]|nr:hypothetical protein [Candidatus Peribacteraceae bacterium]
MDDAQIQRLCNEFLSNLGVSGFIVFGRQDEGNQWKVTYSLHDMPVKTAVRGILSTVDQLVQQNLP